MAKTGAQHATENAVSRPLRNVLPLYIFAGGLALALLAAGADLIGCAALLGENGVLRDQLILRGLVIAAIGATADFTLGQRRLLAWLKPIALDWQGLVKFASLIAQLGMLVVIMRMCYLEHHAFYHQVMRLAFYGFIIHHLLPRELRLPFFIVLSLAGILSVFGLADSAWLLGISLVLIGICHAPIPFGARVTILLAAGGFLTAARFGLIPVPWTKAIWPILASMFMFRFIIYFYDFKHNKAPVGLVNTLAYFFLLPNVAFPLFPVVDYSTFRRTYYNENEYHIYQTGVKWMLWGVVHLLLYRYINYYWVIGPEKVHSTSTLVQYMISNYLLILRLTGQFHLVVGILHLFGFNLPRIMDVFLLSTGFTDYWRRVNVYWKDFIQKVFYYPTYFRMRKAGSTTRLVVATILGFGVTWFFHAYQWFWIRGAFLFSLPDMLFWLSMGLLVLANSIYEAKYGRKRALVKGVASLSEIASKALRATGVFVVMSLLWSLWISPSVSDWTDLLASAEVTFPEVGLALLLVTAAIGSAMLVYEKSLKSSAANPLGDAPAFFRFAAPPAAVILLLYFGVQPTYAFRLGTSVSDLIADLKTDRLNERDAALLERGYYENLTNVSTFNSQLWELYMQKPDDWIPLEETNAVRKTEDFRKYELVPFLNGTVKHAPFITNRWGMRDDDYEQMPPAKTCRIAMIGASVAQGSGVLHEESFEYLVEKRLNQERRGGKYAKYEILNFAVGGYNILQQLAALEKKVFDFKPDMLFCVSHTRDEDRLFKFLLETPFQAIPYEGIQQIMSKAGITAGMKTNRAAKLLEPYNAEIMLWAYQRIVAECRARDVVPVWICLPSEPGLKDSKRAASLSAVAAEAGFVVLNLIDAYDSAKGAYLQVTPWDKHPNAKGHRLLANRIYAALLEHQDKIPLGFSAAANLSASKAE